MNLMWIYSLALISLSLKLESEFQCEVNVRKILDLFYGLLSGDMTLGLMNFDVSDSRVISVLTQISLSLWFSFYCILFIIVYFYLLNKRQIFAAQRSRLSFTTHPAITVTHL